MRAVLLLGLLGASACYSPSYNCNITCDPGGPCPSGYSCVSGFCVAPGQTCGLGSDGSLDGTDGTPQPDAHDLGPWGMPSMVLSTVISNQQMTDPSMRDDLLELSVNINNQALEFFTRSTASSDWSPSSVSYGDINNNGAVASGELSGDGLEMVFQRQDGGVDIYSAQHAQPGTPFAETSVVHQQAVSSGSEDFTPSLSRDRMTLVFSSSRDGNGNLYEATRTSLSSAFDDEVQLSPLNQNGSREEGPHLSTDKLTIYFASDRGSGVGGFDLYMATRATTTAEFDAPIPLTELNTSADETDPWLSPDGRLLLFARSPAAIADYQLWQATR